MASINVVLTDLTFPANLGDEYCKFRPLISIRYRDTGNKIAYAREALPGLGKHDYWECEKDNKNKPGYVRHDTEPKIDTSKVLTSQREINFDNLDIKKLDSVEVEIFDVDIRKGFFDKVVRDHILPMLPIAVAPFIPATLPLTLKLLKDAYEQGTNKKINDLEKSLISKAIGKEDGASRSIWTGSKPLTNAPQQTIVLSNSGVKGNYSVTLEIEVIE